MRFEHRMEQSDASRHQHQRRQMNPNKGGHRAKSAVLRLDPSDRYRQHQQRSIESQSAGGKKQGCQTTMQFALKEQTNRKAGMVTDLFIQFTDVRLSVDACREQRREHRKRKRAPHNDAKQICHKNTLPQAERSRRSNSLAGIARDSGRGARRIFVQDDS